MLHSVQSCTSRSSGVRRDSNTCTTGTATAGDRPFAEGAIDDHMGAPCTTRTMVMMEERARAAACDDFSFFAFSHFPLRAPRLKVLQLAALLLMGI
jgi:hypothetical protein